MTNNTTPSIGGQDQTVEAVAVTQADREVALALHLHTRSLLPGDGRYDEASRAFRSGERDQWRSVQAFARHRLSAIPTPPPASNRDHAELIGRLEKAVLDALDPLPVASPLAVDLRGILKLVDALQAITTQHDNTDLIADWLRTSPFTTYTENTIGSGIIADAIERREYLSADALQAMTASPREVESDGPAGSYPDWVWFTPEDNSSEKYVRASLIAASPREVGSDLIGAVNHLLEVGEFCRTDETSSALQRLRLAADGHPREWRDIATAPKDVWIIGKRDPMHTGRAPAFVGKLYPKIPNAILDEWSGRWTTCTHWAHLPRTSGEG